MCEREKGKEGERAHFLKLKKTVILKIYHANPSEDFITLTSGFVLVSCIIPKLFIYP